MESGIRRCTGARVIAGLLAAAGLQASAATEARHILVLYSNARLLPANLDIYHGLRDTIPATGDRPVVLLDEYLDMPRFGGDAYDHVIESYLREKYTSHPPEVLVAVGREALVFLLSHRDDLFPHSPVVHVGVPTSYLGSTPPLPADVVGVPVEYEFSRTIDQALRWHPRARRLALVTGAAAPDREWEAQLRNEATRFKDRVAAEFLSGLPTGDLLERLTQLGDDAVVFTTGYFQDGRGRSFVPRDSAAAMAAVSAAPVYAPFSTYLEAGVVGGYVPSFEAMGRQAGHAVNQILAGVSPASLRLPEIARATLTVDWRQVRRWGIDESAIPGDAVVLFKPPSLLEAYRYQVLIAVAVLLLQAALIAGILVEHRRRRQAEVSDRAHRFQLAHASRLTMAGELTASIAHEINQPLGAILANADAADLILESGADRRDELRAILADIRRDDLRASEVIRRLRMMLAKREAERRPLDMNEAITEVESMVRAEAQRRQVKIEIRPATTAVGTVGDRFEILQVLINLVLNAMDAVADLPEDRRMVMASVEKGANGIAIKVRDRGPGIAPEHLPRLFDSFFSTKSEGMGLVLAIARTLVEAHGGRIWAENGPTGGAVFHVELPAAREMGMQQRGQA